MKYEYYNIDNYNCVERSLSKILNKDINIVRDDLKKISIELNTKASNEIEVFEEYMRRNNIKLLNDKIDCKIKDLKLSNGKYIIFCMIKKIFIIWFQSLIMFYMIKVMNRLIYIQLKYINIYKI